MNGLFRKVLHMNNDVQSLETSQTSHKSKKIKKNKKNEFIDFTMLIGMRLLALCSVIIMVTVFVFVLKNALPVIKQSGWSFWTKATFDQQITNAYNAPAGEPIYEFGMFGLILGTLFSTFLALIIAIPVGIGAASVLNEYAPNWLKKPSIAVVRLLASIPSIIFGLIGLMVVVPWVEKTFVTVDMQIEFLDRFQMTGRNLLTTGIVLAIMIVPLIVSLTMDSMLGVSNSLREVGSAMGMNRWRITWKIVLPSAKSGIIAGIILATGRGIGEAIAISMVCGGIGLVPNPANGAGFLLSPVLTLASAIINKSEAISVPSIESALFACGAVLLTIGAVLSILSRIIEKAIRKKEGLDA